MALLDDLTKSPNLWLVVGAGLAAPVVLPLIGRLARPLTKTAIRASLAAGTTLAVATERTMEAVIKGMFEGMLNEAIDRVTGVVASARDEISDLAAEARHEYETGTGWLSRGGR